MRPKRLAQKLLAIRKGLDLSQNQILFQLKAGKENEWTSITRENISRYERGTNEPPLPILLRYAQIAGVSTDLLIDDDSELPNRFPLPKTSKRTTSKK
ncbi:MAG TPA: helix-turn-helix domain-containing protein [Blastocatellia bacterium]|nr:helix-turn-helix domain-containing protein [Blastocatellia bacterium]